MSLLFLAYLTLSTCLHLAPVDDRGGEVDGSTYDPNLDLTGWERTRWQNDTTFTSPAVGGLPALPPPEHALMYLNIAPCAGDGVAPLERCYTPPPSAVPADETDSDGGGIVLTETHIRTATEEVGLPRLDLHIEPHGTTLVNFDTNLYAEPVPFSYTVNLLGNTIDLNAVPVSYTWNHGDGTTQTTTSPGSPYPILEVTHQYQQPGTVTLSVDVTYRVYYRINGGPGAELSTTITAPGPGHDLRIREAIPVLISRPR